jgi:transposase
LDMIDSVPWKALRLAGYDDETSPPKIPAFGCCDASKPIACRFGSRRVERAIKSRTIGESR